MVEPQRMAEPQHLAATLGGNCPNGPTSNDTAGPKAGGTISRIGASQAAKSRTNVSTVLRRSTA